MITRLHRWQQHGLWRVTTVCVAIVVLGGLAVGQQIRVVGLSYQYADHYEIDPRLPGDITLE